MLSLSNPFWIQLNTMVTLLWIEILRGNVVVNSRKDAQFYEVCIVTSNRSHEAIYAFHLWQARQYGWSKRLKVVHTHVWGKSSYTPYKPQYDTIPFIVWLKPGWWWWWWWWCVCVCVCVCGCVCVCVGGGGGGGGGGLYKLWYSISTKKDLHRRFTWKNAMVPFDYFCFSLLYYFLFIIGRLNLIFYNTLLTSGNSRMN